MSPSKYNDFKSQARPRRREPHPIWRGVGFLMIVLIPLMAYAAVDVFLRMNGENNWMPLPRDLIAQKGQFLYSIIPDPMIHIKVILFLVFILVFYLIYTLIAFMITSLVMGGPEKRDPYYVAPIRRQRRRQ